MVGFSNDLIQEIGKAAGFRTQIFDVGPNGLFQGLDRERYDGVLSSLMPSVITEGRYTFSHPFFLLGPVLIVPSSSSVTSLEEMKGKTVGVRTGFPLAFGITSPPILFHPYPNIIEALDQLDEGRLDGVIMPALPAYSYIHGLFRQSLKVATPPLTQEGLRLVARKDRRAVELVRLFDKGLKRIKRNGTYDALIKKWNLIDPSSP